MTQFHITGTNSQAGRSKSVGEYMQKRGMNNGFRGRGRGRGRGGRGGNRFKQKYIKRSNNFKNREEENMVLDGKLVNRVININGVDTPLKYLFKRNDTKDTWKEKKQLRNSLRSRTNTSLLSTKGVNNYSLNTALSNYIPVGSSEWCEYRKYIYPKNVIYNDGGMLYNIPDDTLIKDNSILMELENNGWYYDEHNDCFNHDLYEDIKFKYFKVKHVDGIEYKLPVAQKNFIDKHGLCYAIAYEHGRWIYKQNEWSSFWESRRGKKRLKYIAYRERREAKRKQIEEEKRILAKRHSDINESRHKV